MSEVDVTNDASINISGNKDIGNPCFQCRGSGVVSKKHKNENPLRKEQKQGKWLHVKQCCPSCSGSGSICRSRRTNSDGSYRKKRVTKSYPSFSAPGPMPASLTSTCSHLQPGPDEELSYLVGNWKIFQKLDRHRYSTDDLCTSYYACLAMKQLGYESPLMLDIGCGLGSVLMTNAWQFPSALSCVGIEAQLDRYECALRTVEYNVGRTACAGDGGRDGGGGRDIRVIHADLREASPEAQAVCEAHHHQGFDLVTGTPPYFPPATGVTPGCEESSGCLFELRGGVEEYCRAAARYLRRPGGGGSAGAGAGDRGGDDVSESSSGDGDSSSVRTTTTTTTTTSCSKSSSRCSDGDQQHASSETSCSSSSSALPSVFAVCNTALASARVYSGCHAAGLSVVKRIDVVPRAGKPPLFNVFITVANEWLERDAQAAVPLFPPLRAASISSHSAPLDASVCPGAYRVEGSLRGEEVEVLTVRELDGQHSVEYQDILRHLGKPTSRDREVYDVT
jgi:tRNA1Val (adenine37-N6)-methyltransferase